MVKRLVVFDFDGTITKKDSFLEFMKFYRGTSTFYIGFSLLSPIMALFVLKFIPNWKAKEAALKYFFKGEEVNKFKEKCEVFAREILPLLVRPSALKAIEDHKKKGDRVVVISASAENWLQPWCKVHNLELIATRLEVNGEKITGKISGLNCFGDEKACRLKAYLNLEDYEEIFVYGDSAGDKAILKLATHSFYRYFN